MRKQAIASIDTFIVSHPDNDHSAGARLILASLPVRRYRFGDKAVTAGAGGLACRVGETWRWPTGDSFRFLAPADEPGLSSNNASCVLQIQTGDYRILLPGDIETVRELVLVEYWGPDISSDWLLASHHGSATSSSAAFLKTVSPHTVVFSYGMANRFGHPDDRVLRRVSQLSIEARSTAKEGALPLHLPPGGKLRVTAWRELNRYYWM